MVYLFPRAVVIVGIKGHRISFELLYDLLILTQQTHRHLVGATTVSPPTVPAAWITWRSVMLRDTTHPHIISFAVLPVLHRYGRLSVQLFTGETLPQQVDHLPLQAQPATHRLSRKSWRGIDGNSESDSQIMPWAQTKRMPAPNVKKSMSQPRRLLCCSVSAS